MLALIGATALRGLGKVDEGFNRLTKLCLGLIAATLIFAALGMQAVGDGLRIVDHRAHDRASPRCSPCWSRWRGVSKPGSVSNGCGRPGASSGRYFRC